MGLSWILEILFELWSSILYFRDNFYVFLKDTMCNLEFEVLLLFFRKKFYVFL